jgi:hypothetical protein
MSDLISYKIFDPIVPYIRVFKSEGNYIEIEIPPGLSIDADKARKYFTGNAELSRERGKPTFLTGSLKDSSVFSYCMAKYYEVGPKR